MEHQNERNIRISNYLLNSENDFSESFQLHFTKVEFRSYFFFYLFQMLEMLFITVVSTLTFLPSNDNDNTIQKYFNKILSLLYLSPSLFDHRSISYFIILPILFILFLGILYTIYLGYIFKKDKVLLNTNLLKPWIVLQRLVLPIPGNIIGSYFGHYFFELKAKIYLDQLFLSIAAGVLWPWSVISASILYNSYQYKRKNDICQIRPNYILFDCFVTIFPMFQAMIPYIISVFVSTPASKCITSACITSIISFFVIIYLSFNHTYYSESMNNNVTFLFMIKIPLSFIWLVEEIYPAKFNLYLLFCLLFMVVTFALIKILSKCYCQNPRVQIRKNQSNISLQVQDQENPLTPQNDQLIIYDPFIDWPYPFNLVSLTRQDVILIIYLMMSVVTMTTVNGFAAQRIPLTKALPDFIQDHFFVADYLRENITSPFQISNVVVFIQIFLLIAFFLTVPQYMNVRRFVCIYGTLCLIRSVSFLITSLPPPCAGSPNCPCATPEVIKLFKEGNPFFIGLTWLFGVGIFLKYPQCGDLIISGHTMWLWLTTRTLCSVMVYAFPPPFNWLANSVLIVLTLIAMVYIVLSKNHYSIDVWFAFLLVELFYVLYNSLSDNVVLNKSPYLNLYQRLIKFIETRPPKRILMQTRMLIENND